jgi:hypothetical protein
MRSRRSVVEPDMVDEENGMIAASEALTNFRLEKT